MYYLRIDGVNYPVTPGKTDEEWKNRNEQVSLITEQEITLLKQPGLTSFKMDILLPTEEYSWAYYDQPAGAKLEGGFHDPEDYTKLLRDLKTEKEHFELMIVKDVDEDGSCENFTKEVTLEELTITEDADEGGDTVVSCTFKEWVDYQTKVKKKKSTGTTTTTKKPKKKSYTVKKGDTLQKISKKMYGTTKYASKIYSWNKKAIEKAAKKHDRKSSNNGKHIYKGTKLKLKTIKVK